MSTKDEKDWLRAILEGKVKPGDAEWERIWKEEDFTGVRRVLKEVGMRKKDELVADREKMWRVVKQYRGEGKNRRRVSAWRWVSAAMLPLLLGGILWISSREKKDVLVAGVVPEIEAGTPRAVLLMEQGERIDLSLLAGDTILNKGDVRIRLDSSKSVTYERVTGTPTKIEYNTIIVPRKGEYQLILADGSKVYLNSESRLRFPTRFEGKERRVYLEGEGYFEVAKDTAKPFIVEELSTMIASLIANRLLLKGKFSGAQDQEDKVRTVEMKSNDEILMERVMKVVNDYLDNSELNVEMLAEQVGLSRVQLHRKLKELTGIPASEFIRNIRLKQAALLLKDKKMNISQVAYAVGFTNHTHFSTAFKKFYGVSPTDYIGRLENES